MPLTTLTTLTTPFPSDTVRPAGPIGTISNDEKTSLLQVSEQASMTEQITESTAVMCR